MANPGMIPVPNHDGSAEQTLRASVHSIAADVADLAEELDGAIGDPDTHARMSDRLSEELAEAAAMLRSLPGRPVDAAGFDWQLLASLRTALDSGEDLAATIGRALARLAWERGGAAAVITRPGSWEAACLSPIIAGTVGDDLDAWQTTRDRKSVV